MRYQFIQEHRGQFRMTVLLRVLDVSASAFYEWQKRPVSQRARHKQLLVAQICELFEQSKGRYGSLRPEGTRSIETCRRWACSAVRKV